MRWVQILSPTLKQYESLMPLLNESLAAEVEVAAEDQLMLDVTWEWIALDKSALDVANTVAVENGVEHDLLALDEEYARWAKAAARSPELKLDEAAAIAASRAAYSRCAGRFAPS